MAPDGPKEDFTELAADQKQQVVRQAFDADTLNRLAYFGIQESGDPNPETWQERASVNTAISYVEAHRLWEDGAYAEPLRAAMKRVLAKPRNRMEFESSFLDDSKPFKKIRPDVTPATVMQAVGFTSIQADELPDDFTFKGPLGSNYARIEANSQLFANADKSRIYCFTPVNSDGFTDYSCGCYIKGENGYDVYPFNHDSSIGEIIGLVHGTEYEGLRD